MLWDLQSSYMLWELLCLPVQAFGDIFLIWNITERVEETQIITQQSELLSLLSALSLELIL